VTTTSPRTVTFRVNGRGVEVRGDHPHLLAALREELDITSPKDGCSPSGQCGCCTVMIDGKVQGSCQYPVAKAEGRDVITLEGLDEEERERYARAFAAHGGLQCGFCIPGIVLRAKAQVDKKGEALTREDMARHLGAHLCRCTGYVKILDAIEAVAHGTPLPTSFPGDGAGIGAGGTSRATSVARFCCFRGRWRWKVSEKANRSEGCSGSSRRGEGKQRSKTGRTRAALWATGAGCVRACVRALWLVSPRVGVVDLWQTKQRRGELLHMHKDNVSSRGRV